jgi:hypothetical protein
METMFSMWLVLEPYKYEWNVSTCPPRENLHVSLRFVEGDEKESLKPETVKCGHESKGTRTRERLRWRGLETYTKDRPVLSSEGALQKQDRNCQRLINIWSYKAYWLTARQSQCDFDLKNV